MNIIMNILYLATMAGIRLWRLFTYGLFWMAFPLLKARVIRRLKKVGVGVNGSEPQDMQVHNEWLYHRMIHESTLGMGEAYMEGWWDCERLDELFTRTVAGGLYRELMLPWDQFIHYLQFHVFNLQTVARSWEVAEKHYNLGNELFGAFLDKSMNYSCGYWRKAKNLEEAQEDKMDLIGRKLKLEPGMRVLDIGCGWGGLCKFLAEKYQVQVVGITVSKEGAREAQERCKGLPVEIRVQDYRDVDEGFDRIVSVGMFEHVGRQNYRTFFEVANRCLPKHGLFLLHTIGLDNDNVPPIEPWVNKYIFPNGILPDHKNIPEAVDHLFCIEDWHNFGQDYDKTLMAWYENFLRSWPTISHLFDDPPLFYRMWTYYLQLGAGLFRARKFQLWQVVLAKEGVPGGYLSVR